MANMKEQAELQIAKLVSAGKPVKMETVDFDDANRAKTCLEVDFPILSINQVAAIEGNAGKPIYHMSKWWARRRSSVFRSMLIAAATKAPEDPSHSAKVVWDSYYSNHQKKGAFKNLKVADIFMGGGTTLVEGSRLGMQMSGNDLNPVAWFVVKQELADVDLDEVRRLLGEVEAEVKPQIMPYYYCDGPNGEKGKWIHIASGRVEGQDFEPFALTPEQRRHYRYEGPEIIYTFWAKHGPCQVTGCGHRTPIMSNPVMAVKTLTVKCWPHVCINCHADFDIEDVEARMAPSVPFYIAPGEKPFAVIDARGQVTCPLCKHTKMIALGKAKNKKVELSLLIHPEWLAGSPGTDTLGKVLGGSAQDDAASTARWNNSRATTIRHLEVRGVLPDTVSCPETLRSFRTGKEGGTVPKKSKYACASCGTVQDIMTTIRATGKTGPAAGYAIQGYSEELKRGGSAYNGRFFEECNLRFARQYNAAVSEWEARKDSDLADYWPRTAVPFGFMTALNNGDIREGHGFTHWWTMFNPRQLLVQTQLLKAIMTCGNHSWDVREYVLGAFQQYLRNQNSFCIWNPQRDTPEPMFSNNNFHPKATFIENSVFPKLGRGNWSSCIEGIIEGSEWAKDPWDTVSVEALKVLDADLAEEFSGKGEKVRPHDPIGPASIYQASSTELTHYAAKSIDLVITDPPFGGLLHYSELSDFFHVWLRLALAEKYPDIFGPELTPKALEAVANRARDPEDPGAFYQRLLTQCWREAFRVLKPGGILAFTFHHSEDEPWVAVLESLFDAGFYLEAAYPIRSDETKGEGAKPGTFGSQLIEYDIIHVCRKRTEEPTEVSWGRMRREVLADVRQLQQMLENHARAGLPAADLQVIRRGKALEYFSRHYGKVYVDEGRPISVRDALIGINQLIDEDANKANDPPPVTAEPITRQFLSIFQGKSELARDQMQKLLRGSGIAPDEFVDRGWASEQKKIFCLTDPLDFARDWQGRHKRRLTADFDQALVLIGACYDASGINASDTLKNENFRPHAALKSLLDWLSKRGSSQPIRNASSRALSIYTNWADSNRELVQQLSLFQEE
jgi:putative DNA methylase